MKRKNLVRIIAYAFVMVLMTASFAGCGDAELQKDVVKEEETEQESVASEEASITDVVESTDDDKLAEDVETSAVDLIQSIKTGFAASELPEDYNQPIYNLPADYVFEFECSEEAGYVAYMAFQVYDNADYKNLGNMSYNRNTYDNGKITVAPDGALYLNEYGSTNVDDGTWGSLNQLYLVQYIDLSTGEELERPIVTPFTIQHDLNAPAISQGVDENNCYVLSWEEIPGAVEYRVYEHFLDYGYKLECKTTGTSVSVEEFESQKKSDEYHELLMQDFANAGYDSAVTETDGVFFMNKGVKYSEQMQDGYFLVVAVDATGKQSGISNIVDVRDMAFMLPYQIVDTTVEVDISSVEDIPAYVEIEMVDGSIQQMIIDYHGAQTYIYPEDELKMAIKARVANSLFDSFYVILHGMKHADVMEEAAVVTQREDELLSRISGVKDPDIRVTNSTSKEMKEVVEKVVTVNPTAEPVVTEAPTATPTTEPVVTEAPTATPTAEPVVTEAPVAIPAPTETPAPTEAPTTSVTQQSVPVQLMYEVAAQVQKDLDMLGSDKVNEVLFATNDLEAWMALCLITQSEVIPAPIEIFPDAANSDYAVSLLMEAYRQNPTSGFVYNMRYSPDYQAFVVEYLEEKEERLEKTKAELDAAYSIAEQLITQEMSDYEKVLAINEYFRLNASYDFDSTETQIDDYSTLSEQFIDSHTPYGILCKDYGVCESYSEAFVLTARFAGLEAMCEIGALYGGGHEWNRVKVDGSWCVLDVTNNDTDIFVNGLFNITDEQMEGILVPNNAAIRNHGNYAATDDSKEYYYVNGNAVTDIDMAAELLAKQLEVSDTALVRIPTWAEKEDLEEILSQLVYEEGVNFSKAGERLNILCVIK